MQRLNAASRVVSLADLREALKEEFGSEGESVSDAELRAALLRLSGHRDPSAAMTRPGQSVTCTPLPDGWVPLDVFRRG